MCVFVCVSLFVAIIKKVNNFHKKLPKQIRYAESEFDTFEFVICKFNFVHMNIK